VLPDEACARSLRRALEPFGVEIEAVDGNYEVSVALIDQNPESRVVSALDVIDRWLIAGDLPFVQVHLDGAIYTISSPVEQRKAEEPPLNAPAHPSSAKQ
jgi:hypothetical protein